MVELHKPKFQWNCALFDKSMKFGTPLQFCILKRDLYDHFKKLQENLHQIREFRENQGISFSNRENQGKKKDILKNQGKSGSSRVTIASL